MESYRKSKVTTFMLVQVSEYTWIARQLRSKETRNIFRDLNFWENLIYLNLIIEHWIKCYLKRGSLFGIIWRLCYVRTIRFCHIWSHKHFTVLWAYIMNTTIFAAVFKNQNYNFRPYFQIYVFFKGLWCGQET